jgi:hypothetical protein
MRTLFVNLQREGLTFAIQGPFAQLQGAASPRPARAPLAGAAGLGAGVLVLAFAALAHRKRGGQTGS